MALHEVADRNAALNALRSSLEALCLTGFEDAPERSRSGAFEVVMNSSAVL